MEKINNGTRHTKEALSAWKTELSAYIWSLTAKGGKIGVVLDYI